ncbi:MAG TPA: LacI family DNA-binding transcriptional regulator [Candidatus Limnocylindria bacterium]
MSARATIADVAHRSGVSTATVSRVLSGSVPARAATRERVLAAARELDYRPSAIARALKRSETLTIGLLITDIGNPFFPQVVRAVEDEAHRRGYGVVLCNAADDPERELTYLDLLIERRVDGLIVASARTTRRHADRLAQVPMPVVLVNAEAPAGPLPSVTVAHRLGAQLAAGHLLGLGHRRIGHIAGPSAQAAAARLRHAGVTDALRAAGIDAASLVVAEGDEHVDGGARATEQLLAEDPRPTGIVGYNDLSAIGALRAIRTAGLRVPEDVSVVGFDDIELAAWTDPPLTTVRQPTEALGRWAVEHLTAGGPRGEPIHVVLEPTLVVRSSTAPPAVG